MTACCIGTRNTHGYCRVCQGPQGPRGLTGPTGPPAPSLAYGCFINTNSIPVANVNEPTIVSYTANVANSGVSYNGNGEIIVSTSGSYLIGVSPEFKTNTNNNVSALVWLRQNYNDVPDSASLQSVTDKNTYIFTYVEYITPLVANDHVQILFASGESTMSMGTFAANSQGYVHPAVPSVIVTVQQLT